MKNYISAFLLLFLFSCHSSKKMTTRQWNLNKTIGDSWNTPNPIVSTYGRTLVDNNNDLILIGSASYAEFTFTSDSCIVYLKNIAYPGDYNYVVIELDNTYMGRLKVDGTEPKPYTIKSSAFNSSHLLRIFKATESHNGQVAITSVKATGLKAVDHPLKKKIEFIGNSITCGMASDTKDIPCGTGKWYDQHNAYLAYGPRIARALNVDFMLSSVSGIGIYRNWNSTAPTMPQVYESAYLDIDSTQRWDFSKYTPDVVSICLGTNDFSDGDGKTARLPFDSASFISHYIDFVGMIYKHYPSTQVALLTSPMISGAKGDLLFACLQTVKGRCHDLYPGKAGIEILRLQPMVPKGCGYHPDIADHEVLAKEMTPFFQKLLGK
ncbi:MAG: GDSL-type esterase/lipase family protein [Chitinophagaceae bacterium]